MRLSLVVLLFTFIFITSAVRIGNIRFKSASRLRNKFKVGFSKIGRGFKSLVCRMKHRKVVLHSNKKFDRCEKKCPYLYKEKYSLHWGHHCVPMVIPYGCLDENCIRCKPGFYWMSAYNQKSSCRKVCPLGYFGNILKVCEKCEIKDCDRCSGSWLCTKCNSGKVLYKTVMGSVVCIDKCPSTHSSQVVDGEKQCVVIPTTEKATTTTTTTTTTAPVTSELQEISLFSGELPSGCIDVTCMRCKEGYLSYVFATGGRACVQKCPKGQVPIQGLCVSCYDRRCSKCDSSLSECFDCFPGYAKVNGAHGKSTECVIECPTKYREVVTSDGNRTCVKDSASDCEVLNCEKCESESDNLLPLKCSQCNPGFVLFDGQIADHCYRTCPPGYDVSIVNGVSRCIEILPTGCEDKQCQVCRNKYFGHLLTTGTRACVKQCPQGFTDIQGLCVACYDHRCKKCDSSLSDCMQCFPGYAKVVGAQNMTTECAIECPSKYEEKNINETRVCLRKEDSACPIFNCEKCVEGSPKELRIGCLSCKPGFVLFRDSVADHCYRNCPPGYDESVHPESGSTICSAILPPGCMDKECLKCEEGFNNYFLLTGGRVCVEKCPDGYAPVKGLCVACTDRRCMNCSSSLSECVKCFPGYAHMVDALNSTTECVVDCPFKYKESVINNVRVCLKEAPTECPVSNCKRCIDSHIDKIHFGCLECDDGFVLHRGAFADRCYKNCPAGYYPSKIPDSNIRTCVECKSPFCRKCVTATKCLKCHEPLILDRYKNVCRTCPALTNYNFKAKRCVNIGNEFYGGNVIVK